MKKRNRFIEKAIAKVGSTKALADAVGVKPPTVSQWKFCVRPVPAERCIAIEAACEGVVTRYQLKPKVFGSPPATLPHL